MIVCNACKTNIYDPNIMYWKSKYKRHNGGLKNNKDEKKKATYHRLNVLAWYNNEGINDLMVRGKKNTCRCRMLIEMWIWLLWIHIFLRLSPWVFFGGPQLGLFTSRASEHQEQKMDPFADFTKSNQANERGRIQENPIVINSTCCICLRQNHSRPSTPHGSQDYSLAPHTPAESQKSGAPWKTVKNDASDFRCRNFCSAASCVRPMWWTCSCSCSCSDGTKIRVTPHP